MVTSWNEWSALADFVSQHRALQTKKDRDSKNTRINLTWETIEDDIDRVTTPEDKNLRDKTMFNISGKFGRSPRAKTEYKIGFVDKIKQKSVIASWGFGSTRPIGQVHQKVDDNVSGWEQ